MYSVDFEKQIKYSEYQKGIGLEIVLIADERNPVSAIAKLDTGSEFCVFQRKYAELLDLEIERGIENPMRTINSSFNTFGHEVKLLFSGFELSTTIYFPEFEIPRSVVGRTGFFNMLKIGLVEYEQLLYFSLYNES